MKLFTIGDSVSQGFMSLAAARTEQSYSAILARCLRVTPYDVPRWPAGGLPANLEAILRALENRYHTEISGFDWLTVLPTINSVVDAAEDYYERGSGSEYTPASPPAPFFHNVAVWGFKIADAWSVTPTMALEAIEAANRGRTGDDNVLGTPNAAMYRTARTVLNPAQKSGDEKLTQLDWLRRHHAEGEGVENLLLFLGANNVLGTLLSLTIHQTPGDGEKVLARTHFEREHLGWNLWHPVDFAAEYRELVRRVDEILDAGDPSMTKVFVGTVPLVTICPLAKGVGPTVSTDDGTYFKYYTYFPFDESFIVAGGPKLTTDEARFIDRCIRQYNKDIRAIVAASNLVHPGRYHVVDTCDALERIAYKRNDGNPTYVWPEFFEWVFPRVNTKYYHADPNGKLVQGGLFSLDGVHPSAIGQGLIAWEFFKVMSDAGVAGLDPINWADIVESDDLFKHPIRIMQEIYKHEQLANHVVGAIQSWRG